MTSFSKNILVNNMLIIKYQENSGRSALSLNLTILSS